MLASQARRFGETLVERHVLSRDDLEHALDEASQQQLPLPAVLLRRGLVGSKDLTAALAAHMGIRFVDFLDTPIHQDAPMLVPADVARKHLALPVDFEERKLVVAFAEPADDSAVAAIGTATGYEIIPAVADRAELLRAIDMIYGVSNAAGVVAGDPTRVEVGVESLSESNPDEIHINDLLDLVLQYNGSDLHLTAGSPPIVRVHGDLHPMSHLPTLNGSQIRHMVYSIVSQKQREKFENELELDTSYALPGKGRFRVNIFLQRDSVGCVMRAIPYEIVPIRLARRAARREDLGVPASRSRARHRPDRFG